MSDDEAKIKVTVLADEAKRAAADLKRDWKDTATTIANAWRSVASQAGSAAQQTLASVGKIATAADLISFDKAIASTQQFNATFGKTAVASGRSLIELQDKFGRLGVKILETPQHVAQAAKALNRHTYDLNKSAAALEVVGTEGLFNDRSIDELGEFTKLLAMGASNAAQMSAQLDKVRATSAALGTKGGATAVMDWANQNQGTLARMTGTVSSGSRGAAMAIRAAMPSDLPPELADEAASGLIGNMVQNPRAWERSLGMKWGAATDKYGRLKMSPLEMIKRAQKYVTKLAGGDAERARGIAQSTLGNLGGGALMGIDVAKAEAAMNSPAVARGAGILADSPELAEARARAKAEAAALQTGGGVVGKTAGMREWLAGHPFLAGLANSGSGFLSGAAGSMVTSGMTLAGAKALGMFGASGAGAAGGSAGFATMGAMGMMGALGGGALLGAGLGTAVDQIGNIGAPEGQDWSLSGMFAQRAHEIAMGEQQAPLTPEVLAQFGIGGGGAGAQNQLPAAIGDAVASAMERAARGEKMSIVVRNYTGGPIEAIEEDAQAGAQ